jgi:hypothetical protein
VIKVPFLTQGKSKQIRLKGRIKGKIISKGKIQSEFLTFSPKNVQREKIAWRFAQGSAQSSETEYRGLEMVPSGRHKMNNLSKGKNTKQLADSAD